MCQFGLKFEMTKIIESLCLKCRVQAMIITHGDGDDTTILTCLKSLTKYPIFSTFLR